MRNSRIALFLAVGAVTPLVTALTPATASAAENSLRPYLQQKPAWHRCDTELPASLQCATIKVPLDYGRPGGKKLDLAISRMKTSTEKERRGVLLLNPGGPGGPGVDMPQYMADELPKAVKNKYDLVGFDPRGIGQSSPVGCGLTSDERNWERPYKAETFTKDVKWARTVAEKCDKKQGDKLRHITTRNTARDMDVIRAVLGEKKISYLGYSYGTYLGAVYTQMFPKRTDRFVLDSAVDPARIWRGMIQVWAEGAEPAFTRWTEWTAARHATYKLGRTPEAVRKTFYGLVAQADRKPIDLDGTLLTGDDIRHSLRGMFFGTRDAAEAVAELKKAAAGAPPSADRELKTPEPVPPSFGRSVPEDNGDAGFWAVVCADTRAWPRDPEQYRKDAIRDKARYPLYGDFASHIKPCAFWKKNGSEPATRIGNKVRALILQNEWDSQTPLTSGQGLRRAMKGSKMVTVAGGVGHGIYGTKSCADKTATTYLTTGKLPTKDLTCKAAPAADERNAPDRLPLPTPPGIPGMVGRF
ncbi:alpha/beta hydrolase [Streptomyces cahuitamycinicus]|uniref:Alpha/beta hydrolase n=1 Tax=Streptomyces cahuitamycinicus TaxID=2070367 RepID=A0A2N8TUT1_9ACTN|nr:alpha/beta hydrolase [Streptomyces cahuitamycinicus]PNG22740.1 alpha/beta hydrolase [Streptomyces cahuitamycinicus]